MASPGGQYVVKINFNDRNIDVENHRKLSWTGMSATL